MNTILADPFSDASTSVYAESFAQVFHATARKFAQEQVFSGATSCTYEQLERRVSALESQVRASGIEAAQVVACSAENAWDRIALALAVLDCKATPKIEARTHETGPEPEAQLKLPRLVLEPAGLRYERRTNIKEGEEKARIAFAGGRGSDLRDVTAGAERFVGTITETFRLAGMRERGCVLAWNELSSDFGLVDLWAALSTGSTLVFPEENDFAAVVQACREHDVNIIWGAPRRFARLLCHGLWSNIERSKALVILGRDQVGIPVIERTRASNKDATVVTVFGSAELSPWSAAKVIVPEDELPAEIIYDQLIGETGAAVYSVHGQRCPTWVPGEIYLSDTRSASGAKGIATGEAGRFVGPGRIAVLGRIGAEYVIDGVVPPRDAQEHWLARQPHVVETWLTRDRSGKPIAWVAGDRANLELSDLEERMAKAFLGRPVPSLKHVSSLPLDPLGRVATDALIDESAHEEKVSRASVSAAPWEERIKAIVEKTVGSSFDANQNLQASGVDSVEFITLANALERQFGKRIPFDRLFGEPTIKALAAFYKDYDDTGSVGSADIQALIVDPVAREAFKKKSLSHRILDRSSTRIRLHAPDSVAPMLRKRRTHRQFQTQPIPLPTIAGLMSLLIQFQDSGGQRRLYPSAGGLYPVQTYLQCQPNRICDVPAGCYYCDPQDGSLVKLTGEVVGSRAQFEMNRAAANSSAFTLYFVAALDAIRPLYGEAALGFCWFEAGAMGQLLAQEGARLGIGFCNIGGMMDADVRRLLSLGESQVLVHTMTGGLVDDLSRGEVSEIL